MKLIQSVAMIAVIGLVAACSREVPLPGVREDLRSPNLGAEGEAPLSATEPADETPENRALPIVLPTPVNMSSWTHLAGSPSHRVQQPALSPAPVVVWSAKIGQGNDRKHRITAQPVVADGRIFTLDSRALVVAHSTSGETLWSTDLTPASDRSDDASGGGLAIGAGRLFVTSGFGTVSALEPASGQVIWTQDLDANASGAPTVVDGMVFVATKDSRGFALNAQTGKIEWQVAGLPDGAGVIGVASPAVTGDMVIFPFSSGEMMAVNRASGERVWNALLAGSHRFAAYNFVTDVTGEPVIADGMIYAGTPVGRTIALSMEGSRVWTADEGAVGPVWVTGGSVFLVSERAELLRLDAATGDRIWGAELPYFTKQKERRRKSVFANFGPLMAGNRLWVASSDGVMRGFNPEDGTLVASVELPGGAATRPVVVGGVLYVVTTKGQLLALR